MPNFYEIIVHLRKKVLHFKKYVTGKVQTSEIKTGLLGYLENWEKSGNLKIDQEIKEKSEKFIKLTDWQSPIERTLL